MTDEQNVMFERIAKAVANSLWLRLSTEHIAEMLEYPDPEDEDDDPGDRGTLWLELVSWAYTHCVANYREDVPFLQRPPKDQDNSSGKW